LFFPKVVQINKPGIIYTCQDRKFGSPVSKRRQVFFFEDIIVNLQLETIRQMGKKKTSDLYYKIGKESGIRCMLISRSKKAPNIMLPSILDYIFKGFLGGGMSFAYNLSYNKRETILSLKGRNNIICRKTGIPSEFAGLVSGIMSILIGKNIEAEARCSRCPYGCCIVASKDIQTKYIPIYNKMKISKEYHNLNFPVIEKNNDFKHSFSHLIRFKKVDINMKNGKFCYKEKVIFPTEIGILGVITDNYIRNRKRQILEKGIIEGTEKLAGELFKEKGRKGMNNIVQILSSLGWGYTYLNYKKNEIIVDIRHAPIDRYNYVFGSLMINGFLNYFFDKKYKIKSIKQMTNPVVVNIEYVA